MSDDFPNVPWRYQQKIGWDFLDIFTHWVAVTWHWSSNFTQVCGFLGPCWACRRCHFEFEQYPYVGDLQPVGNVAPGPQRCGAVARWCEVGMAKLLRSESILSCVFLGWNDGCNGQEVGGDLQDRLQDYKHHLAGGLEHFFHILGVISPTDWLIFSEGWLNHQPVIEVRPQGHVAAVLRSVWRLMALWKVKTRKLRRCHLSSLRLLKEDGNKIHDQKARNLGNSP